MGNDVVTRRQMSMTRIIPARDRNITAIRGFNRSHEVLDRRQSISPMATTIPPIAFVSELPAHANAMALPIKTTPIAATTNVAAPFRSAEGV